ncbi:PE/PPE C-terminal domain-containing protein [Mycobacterium simiae]|uniref:PE/PPE C-terminal domain-containing protein n=1 Tax=Mycobacterium simiae TaxID=1784 RepID=UPI00165F9249|nr:PE/PPE C-terminal domain-containing protein [Mycobacterium simiae]
MGELDVVALYIASVGTASLGLSIVNTTRPFGSGGCCGSDDTGGGIEPTQGNAVSATTDASVSAPSTASGGVSVSAGVGPAALLGGLSVPHGWTMAAPEIKLAVESAPSASLSAAATNIGGMPPGLLSGMALASLAGRGIGGGNPRATKDARPEQDGQVWRKPTVVVIQHPPPTAGPNRNRPL